MAARTSKETTADLSGIPAAKPGGEINFWSRFKARELETEFRQKSLPGDLTQSRAIAGVTFAGFLLFAISDYHFFGWTPELLEVWSVRAVVLAAAIFVWRKFGRLKTPFPADRWLLAFNLLLLAATVYVTATRPPEYTGHSIVNVMIVVLVYCAMPLPLILQTMLALGFTAAIISLCYWIKPMTDGTELRALIFSLCGSNFLGAVMSRQLQLWKRRQFLALRRQTGLRHELELALSEIKTLRGILRICAHCKKIRDDSGNWQQIEFFVRDHTHATFSHSVCPECSQKHYPEIYNGNPAAK